MRSGAETVGSVDGDNRGSVERTRGHRDVIERGGCHVHPPRWRGTGQERGDRRRGALRARFGHKPRAGDARAGVPRGEDGRALPREARVGRGAQGPQGLRSLAAMGPVVRGPGQGASLQGALRVARTAKATAWCVGGWRQGTPEYALYNLGAAQRPEEEPRWTPQRRRRSSPATRR